MIFIVVGHRLVSIGQLPRDEQAATAVDFHAGKALIETRDQPSLSLGEDDGLGITHLGVAIVAHDRLAVLVAQRLAMVFGGVEFDSIGRAVAGIGDRVQLARLGFGAGANFDLLVGEGKGGLLERSDGGNTRRRHAGWEQLLCPGGGRSRGLGCCG